MIILFFISFLLCLDNFYKSSKLKLNFSYTFSVLSAQSPEDHLISIITNEGNIVFGGIMCSFIGELCFVNVLVFDKEFHSIFQKKISAFGLKDHLLGIIETQDKHYILVSEIKISEKIQINAYFFSQNLESLTIISHLINNCSIINQVLSSSVELQNSYRIYFSAMMEGGSNCALFSIDIDKTFRTKVENSFDNSLQGTGCLYSTLHRIFFFKQIGEYYYYGGSCLKNGVILPGITKFDNLLHPLFSFVAPETSQYASFHYVNFFLDNSNSLLLHYKKENDAYNQLNYDRLKMMDLTFIETIVYPLPAGYSFKYSKNFLVKNNFAYTILSLSPQPESNEKLLSFQLPDRICIINLVIDNKRYPPTSFNAPTGQVFTSYSLYNYNSSFLLSDGSLQHQFFDYDLVVHLISILNPSNPTFARTIVYGGTGNYLSSYIINFNQSCFLIFGMDGIGMYLLFYSKENLSLITENKFRLEYHIKKFSVLLLPNNKIIIIGNYDSGNLNPFFAEVDRFLYGQPFEPFGWMVKDILLMCTINIDETRFALGGSLIGSSGTSCYYAEISLDYTLIESPIIHSITGVKCIVDLLLITEDKSIVVALGRDILSGKGLILSIKPFLSNTYLPNEKKVKFNSFSQISSNLLLGGGSLTDGTFNISYYITFSTNLEFISDWGDSKNDPSEVSNFLMITKNISVSTTTIINDTPYLRFMRIIPNLLVIDNIYIHIQLDNFKQKSSRWSIEFLNNNTIIVVGSEKNNLYINSLITSIIKYSPICPQKNQIYNPFDMKCYEDCTLFIQENNFTCLESQNNLCINCLFPGNYDCTTDKFILETRFCEWNVEKLEIILETIEFDINEKIIKAKFNQNVRHFHYKLKLFLQYSNDQVSSSVFYNYYAIKLSEIKIFGVQYSSLENSPDIVLNLTILKITSEQGVPLSNPIIKVKIHSTNSDSLINSAMNLQEEISNFLSRNKYYYLE